jgi:hypothetical protein
VRFQGANNGNRKGPPRLTKDNTPAFAFSGWDKFAGLRFSHKVVARGVAPESVAWSGYSPRTSVLPGRTTGLDDGSYTFLVKAKDAAGNIDASPASRTFTVDTVSPGTTIHRGPTGMVSSAEARFTFSSKGEKRPTTFKCSLDDEAYTRCKSPWRHPGLSNGKHTFLVKAKDAAGNVDPTPAERTWTVC